MSSRALFQLSTTAKLRGESVRSSFVGIDKAEIAGAEMKGSGYRNGHRQPDDFIHL